MYKGYVHVGLRIDPVNSKGVFVMRKRKYPSLPNYLRILYICIFLSLVVWLFTLCSSQKYFKNNPLTNHDVVTFHEGWVDDDGNAIVIPNQYEVAAGEDFRIHHVFQEDESTEHAILFRTDHTYVRAYMNGEEIYRFGTAEEIPFGKSPGSGWQLIELGEVTAGDVLTIEQNCPYDRYSGLIREIQIGTKAELLSEIMLSGLGMLLVTAIPFLVGIFIIMLPPFFFREYPPHIFFNVGISFVMISLWSFTEARTWQLFFRNAYAMQILNFVTFSLFVPCVLLSTYTMGYVRNRKLYRIMLNLDTATALILLGLQVLNIADYFETLLAVHLMIVANALIFITSFVRNTRAEKGLPFWLGAMLYLAIAVAAFMDLMDFYVWDYFGNGFFSRLVILTLLVCAGLTTMRRAMRVHKKLIEQMTYERMAYTDDLTGLKNRRAFDEDIERIENNEQTVTILYADMNGLKSINDNHGHHYGDEALQLIAERLKEFRDADTNCYRLGGDEFCVLSYTQTEDEMRKHCEEINRGLTIYEEKYDYPIGISYGVQKYTPHGELTMHQCLVNVDKMMYSYKEEVYAKQGRAR